MDNPVTVQPNPGTPAEPATPAPTIPPITPSAEPPKAPPATPPAEPPKPDTPPAPVPSTPPEPKPTAPPAEPAKPAEYVLAMPKDSLIGKEVIDNWTKVAKEKGFDQKDAQGVLELLDSQVKAYASQQKAQLENAPKQWVEESKADKEIGGEAFPQNVELGHRVVSKFGSPLFVEYLNKTGLGNHPELLRFCARIGRVIGDDIMIVGSTNGATNEKSAADKLYPTQAK